MSIVWYDQFLTAVVLHLSTNPFIHPSTHLSTNPLVHSSSIHWFLCLIYLCILPFIIYPFILSSIQSWSIHNSSFFSLRWRNWYYIQLLVWVTSRDVRYYIDIVHMYRDIILDDWLIDTTHVITAHVHFQQRADTNKWMCKQT